MSATDGLFAAKGQAQPVDQTRGATDMPPETDSGTVPAREPAAAPLTDLFGEPLAVDPANETGAETGPDGGDAEAEPPPAASLLTIVSQKSAARRRAAGAGLPEATAPDTFVEEPDEEEAAPPVIDRIPGETGAENASIQTINLPVPVVVQLPVATGDPDTRATGEGGWNRRVAAVAACVAICIVAGAAILSSGTEQDPAVAARADAPSGPDAQIPDEVPAPAVAAAPEPEAPGKDVADSTGTSPADNIAAPPTTKIDAVRIDVKGQARVTGQAPPAAELIVLHNRQPLGTARADAAGLWTFSAAVPTRTMRNEISVVPLRIDNSVMVTDVPAVPRPGRRPAIPSYYFAQIASLPSAADAGREAAKLAVRLDGIIASHRISVRVATIGDGRKVYRVSIGGFATKADAAGICDRIRARNSRCLVMRGS